MRIFVQLLSWHHSDVFALLLKITQHLFEYHIGATRLVNLGLPKAFIQLFRMQVHIPYIQTGVTYSSKLGFAILEAFYSMVKQLVPKLQHVISKTVTLMCKASSLCDSV